MKSNILIPATFLPERLIKCITNLIKLINGEKVDERTCFIDEGHLFVFSQNREDVLSAINDCLLLVKKDPDKDIEEMWKKFQSKGYDCTAIFFKIAFLYYNVLNYKKQENKPTTVNKTDLQLKLRKLRDIFDYLRDHQNVELITDYNPGYEEIVNKDTARDTYCFDSDYNFFLILMYRTIDKIANNIKYKCSDEYKLHVGASHIGTIFNDKSKIMIRGLFVVFQKEFGQSYTKYITIITKTLFPEKKGLTTKTVSAIFSPLNKNRKKIKKLERL